MSLTETSECQSHCIIASSSAFTLQSLAWMGNILLQANRQLDTEMLLISQCDFLNSASLFSSAKASTRPIVTIHVVWAIHPVYTACVM